MRWFFELTPYEVSSDHDTSNLAPLAAVGEFLRSAMIVLDI